MSALLITALLFISIGAVVIYKSCCKKETTLAIGSKAPDFSLIDEKNHLRSLSEMKGKNLVLYFYPKDFTPGCTAQACSIRDGFSLLKERGIEIYGISYDLPESHKDFKEKYNLPFSLLSDSHKQVAKLYGVKGVLFANRVTYLINKDGIIIGVLKDVDVAHHAQQIIDTFGKV